MIDPRMRALLASCVLGGVSFAVAAGLYLIFGKLNSAEVHWASEEVKLGGPIAGFAATFLLLAWFVNRFTKRFDSERAVSSAFAGSWRVTSKSSGPHSRQAFSNTEARLDDSGHISFTGSLLDDAGQSIGEWSSNEVFCTPGGFAYRYHLIDKLASDSSISLGFCSVHVTQRDDKGRPTILKGNWDVIASKQHHEGSIEFERQHA